MFESIWHPLCFGCSSIACPVTYMTSQVQLEDVVVEDLMEVVGVAEEAGEAVEALVLAEAWRRGEVPGVAEEAGEV